MQSTSRAMESSNDPPCHEHQPNNTAIFSLKEDGKN